MLLIRKLFLTLIILLLISTPSFSFAQNREDRVQILRDKAAERKSIIEEKRTDAKERFASKREEFKEKALQIRDEKKQEIVQRVDSRITTLNQKHTDRFSDLLDKLSSILDRIEARALDLEDRGANTSEVDVAVQTARDAIGVAEGEVVEQAGKDYIIEIGSDSNLGTVVSSAFNEFKNDMQTLQASVKVVRDAVHEAAVALKEVISNLNTENGSAE
ncbi:MAG: hypothetical protein WEC80_02890 [Patescibacteria group bacterium]